MQGLLFSARPAWAFMPRYVATHFADNLLFLLSALERAGLSYVAHFGTLLGAVRLRGVCPWDEDADVYLIDEDRRSVEDGLRDVLESHGFQLVYDARDFFWVKPRPWWAGQGHIGLSFLPRLAPAGAPRPTHPDDPSLAREELFPLTRLSYHGTWIWGPADPDSVIRRLYGETGSVASMARFRAPSIDREAAAFWATARAPRLDWDAISARFRGGRGRRRLGHARTWPWWWWNGAYNIGVRQLRRLGESLAERAARD